ncbi:putative TonB-dependent receptor [Sphingomonas paucimobilis]|nr:putative TonB-dependent receptor [Sphingomonas paucimobilis]
MISRITLMALLGASPFAIASAAQAQTEQSANSGVADIVVTATRQEKSLQDTPAAVDVVTSEDIRDLNIFDVKEVQNLAPGLELTNNTGRSNVATLRGITFDPDSGSAAAVDLFFNEIPTDAQTMFTAIYDIGQIEVLRGPQGLFRGRTSPAGAILIGAQRPDLNDFTGYVQATGTNRRAANVQGAANLPLIADKLALRAALLYDENDLNYVRNIDGRRPSSKTMSGRVSLAYDSGSGLAVNLTYQHLYADNRPLTAVFGPGNQPSPLSPDRSGPALSPGDRTSVTEGRERFQNRTDFVTLNARYDLGAAEIVFNGGYQDTLLSQRSDLDRGNAVPNYTLDQDLTTAYKVSNAELRLQSSGASRFTWALSGNYTHQKNVVNVLQEQNQLFALRFIGPIPPSINFFPINADVGIDILSKTYGLAGTVGYELLDGLTVTGGLRHTWADISRTQTVSVTLPSIPTTLPTSVSESDLKKRALTGGANISWEVTPDLTAYANYGHSYRQGVFAVGVSVPLDPDLLVTPDETSDGVEVGVKTFFFDRKVSLNLAAFYQKFKNYISYAPGVTTDANRDGIVDATGTPLPFTGDAISKGVEMQLDVRPSENLNFGINASYTDAHWDNASVPCNDFNNDGTPDADGTPTVQPGQQVSFCTRNDRISRTPKFSLTANGELRIPTGSVEPFIRGLVNYRPGFYSLDDDYRYRAYTKVDLFIGLRDADERWEISAFAKNLLNQTRVLAASQGTIKAGTAELGPNFQPTGAAGIPFDSGYRTAVLNPPREFGVSLKYNW